jgi:hypothetical protein
MMSTAVAPAARGFEDRTFGCMKCGCSETRKMVADPVIIGAADGWLNGELGRSA